MLRIVALALVLVTGSGCLAEESPPVVEMPEAESGNETAAPNIAAVVFQGSGTVAASAGPVAASNGGGVADVDAGATLLYVEWRWDDPVQDLDGALSSPSAGSTGGVENLDHTAEGGAPGSPDNPHSLTLSSPEVGQWGVSMIANGAAGQVDYEFRATVFYGATTVPDGYTAF